MLNEVATSAVSRAPIDVGLTAFRVAAEQQKVFEKTIEEVSKRKEHENKTLARDAEEQRQRVRENLAQARGGVDVVVEDNDSQSSQSAPEAESNSASASAPASKGREVNIEV